MVRREGEGIKGIKVQEFLGWGPPQRHQLGLLLCHCAGKKWFCGMGLRCGRAGVEPVRKPGVTASGAGRERDPPGHCGAAVKGLRCQQGQALPSAVWLPGRLLNGHAGEFP